MEKAYKGFGWAVNPGLSFYPKRGLPEGALAGVPEARARSSSPSSPRRTRG